MSTATAHTEARCRTRREVLRVPKLGQWTVAPLVDVRDSAEVSPLSLHGAVTGVTAPPIPVRSRRKSVDHISGQRQTQRSARAGWRVPSTSAPTPSPSWTKLDRNRMVKMLGIWEVPDQIPGRSVISLEVTSGLGLIRPASRTSSPRSSSSNA